MNKPSSTIQASSLAAAGMTLLWAILSWLQIGPEPTPVLIGSSVTFAGLVAGYFKKENVYPEGWKDGPG